MITSRAEICERRYCQVRLVTYSVIKYIFCDFTTMNKSGENCTFPWLDPHFHWPFVYLYSQRKMTTEKGLHSFGMYENISTLVGFYKHLTGIVVTFKCCINQFSASQNEIDDSNSNCTTYCFSTYFSILNLKDYQSTNV